MGGLLSTTIYAAASVTAATPSADSAMVEAVASAAPPTEYVIVDIPAFNRTAAALPPVAAPPRGEPIEDLDFDLAQAARRFPELGAIRSEPASSEIGSVPTEAGFQDAVVAAHNDRINLLRQRLARATLNEGAGATPLIRDLQLRLRRAEAARSLAVVRARSAAVCDARCAAPGGPGDAHARAAIDSPSRVRSPATETAASPPVTAFERRTAADRAVHANTRRAAVERSTIKVASGGPAEIQEGRVGSPSHSAADPDRLAFSRQRLATARRVLENGPDLSPLMAGAAVISSTEPASDSAGAPLKTADILPFDAFDPHLFWTFAAAKFGMAIASLLLLLVLGAVIRPRQLAARQTRSPDA